MDNSVSLYESSRQIDQLMELLEVTTDETARLLIEEELTNNVTHQGVKIENYKEYIEKLDADVEMIEERIARLKLYQRRLIARKEKMLSTVGKVMIMADTREILGIYGARFSFRQTSSVMVHDESLLPEKYVRTKITHEPNKEEIKKALKAGEIVPGAVLKIDDKVMDK